MILLEIKKSFSSEKNLEKSESDSVEEKCHF
jgi:hypothetical protein